GLRTFDRARQRFVVHMRQHENVAGRGVRHHASDQSVAIELGGEDLTLFDFLVRWTSGEPERLCGWGRSGTRHRCAAPTTFMKRAWTWGSSRKTPRNCVVTVCAPTFATPRQDMQVCSARNITATPRGLRTVSIDVAICELRCSCVCSRNEK